MATLKAEPRVPAGTEVVQRMRRTGLVPAVVCGRGLESRSVAVCAKEMGKVIRDEGVKAVLTLDIDGAETTVRVQEIQREPVTRALLHIDFQVVAAA